MKTRLRLSLLRAASWITPRDARGDWLAEWTAELWYVERNSVRATEFCFGAFRDAWWLRCYHLNPALRQILRLETPRQCLSVLATIAAVIILLLIARPSTRNMFTAPPYRDPHSLVMVSLPGYRQGTPTISPEKYQRLYAGSDRWFSRMAFYQPASLHVRAGNRSFIIWGARASVGLFDLLGVPLLHNSRGPVLVLSESARRRLGGGPITVDGSLVEAPAVIADSAWRLPGHLDAFLLVDDSQFTASPYPLGYVVARSRTIPNRPYWYLPIPRGEDEHDTFECIPPFRAESIPAAIATVLAFCLILMATTTASLGLYPVGRDIRWTTRLRRWIFLSAKTGLVFLILICGLSAIVNSPVPQLAAISFILACRWVISDQRRRCPVCLRILANPVRIGRPSQTFLEWYGTELMCTQGHGLMHISEIVSSCYIGQKWTDLDGSWSGLFSQPAGVRPLR